MSSQRSNSRAALTLGLVVAIVASLVLVVTPTASAGGKSNAGTLKVTQDASCATEPNNPWVLTPYFFGGTGFSPGVPFTVTAVPHGGNSGTGEITQSGETDDEGAFCIGPFTTGAGQMKVTYTDPEDSKHKVYNVRVEVTPQEPTVTEPTCEDPGTLVLPDTTGVTYTVEPKYTGPGTYTVTASPEDDYVFPDDATTTWTMTVEDTEECAPEPEVVTPEEPTVTEPTCEDPGTLVLPDTTGVTYTVEPKYTGPGTYTVTATPDEGYAFPEKATTTWTVTVEDTEECAPEPEVVTPQEPTVTAPTCEAPGAVVLPDTTGVTYTVDRPYDGPGTYTVTATPDEGYAFPKKATTTWTLVVPDPPSDCPTAPIPATPTAPSFQDPTCTTPAGITLPADTDAIDYTQTGTPAPGATVTVTATARDGYVLEGYTGPWTHTYTTPSCPTPAPAPVVDVTVAASQCSLVNGTSTVQLVVTNRGTVARSYQLTSPGAPTIEGGQLAAGAVRSHVVTTFGTWTLVVEGQAARSVTPSTAGCVAPVPLPEETAVVPVVTEDDAAADSVEGDELDAEADDAEAELASTGADTRAGTYGALLLLAGLLLLAVRRRALR